jgi:hypothetical protein
MAMLAAYLDETGLHGGSEFVAVCGVIGTTIEWSRLERPWAEHLCTSRVSIFHATECDEGNGEFVGKSRAIRDSLVVGLSNEKSKRALDIVVCGVAKIDWDHRAPAHIKDRFETPYHFCFEFVLQKLNTWSHVHAKGEPIAMVFAEHEQYCARTIEVYEHYAHSPEYAHLGLLSFGKPKCLIQLQAADLLAYETYRYMKRRLKGGGDQPNRVMMKLLGSIVSDPENAGFYDCDNLATLAPSGGILKKP